MLILDRPHSKGPSMPVEKITFPDHACADDPLAYGGSNPGMSPDDFVSAALGACTSMTIRTYARQKGWPLSDISVEFSHDKVHAQDCHP